MAPTSGVTGEGRESVCSTTRGLPEEIVREDTDLVSTLFHFSFKAMGQD